MFDDLYDALSVFWSWKWPTANGQVTEVLAERIRHPRGGDTFRLSVAFKFSIGEDGPYTGESFWAPAFCQKKRVIAGRRKTRTGQNVLVRYRSDDPSVNRLDSSVWRRL
jgi:hypothetical protein